MSLSKLSLKPRSPPSLFLAEQGDVRVFGKAREGLLNDDPEAAAALKVGMVFQNGALFDSLTVGENVGFLLYEHSQLPRARIGVSTLLFVMLAAAHA